MLQASKCQVRLFAERAYILKYDEKVHIEYLFVQIIILVPFYAHKCIFSWTKYQE